MVGLSLISSATVLPAFAASLGASTVMIGAIPAVMTIGWFLPPLFAAAHTERLDRKLPFVLRWTGWERLPFPALAIIAFFLADRAPTLSMALLLVMLLVTTAMGGILMPAWMDIIGRAVPVRLRGRFFGVSNLVGTVGGLGGSALIAWALATLPSSTAYGICFLAATVFVGLSWIALALVREPPSTTAPADAGFWTHLRTIPGLLRGDANFTLFLIARVLSFGAAMAAGFFTVYALRVLRAPESDVGAFTALFIIGQMGGFLAMGWIADHAGHCLVIALGVGAAVLMNLVAIVAGGSGAFLVVFALYGIFNAAIQISAVNVVLEFAPSAQQQPTYVGIDRTFLAPFGFGVPLVGGLLVDAVGYRFVFGASAVLATACVVVLLLFVRDPRHGRVLPREEVSA